MDGAVHTDAQRVRAFDARRFALLARALLGERWRTWASYLFVVALVLTLLALLVLLMGGVRAGGVRTRTQVIWFYCGLFFSGYVFAQLYFAHLQRSESALLELMRPASTLEKWLFAACALLLAYPLAYTLVFAAVFSVASTLGYAMALTDQHVSLKAADFALFWPFRPLGAESDVPGYVVQWALWLLYAGVTGYAAATLVWMRRYAGIKALSLGVVLFFASLLVLQLGQGWEGMGVLLWWVKDAPPQQPVGVYVLSLLFWVGVPALLWWAGLRALREKDLA